MAWVLGAAGFLIGGIIGLSSHSGILGGALLGAMIGVLAALFSKATAQNGQNQTLTRRIQTLETAVETLKREVTQLRGQMADTASRTTSPTASPTIPLAEPAPTAATAPTAAPVRPVEMPDQERVPVPPQPHSSGMPPPLRPGSQQPRQQAPVIPSAPPEPGIFERAFDAARNWLFGGNTVVRIGIIVLFFGVAFLLKYAADNSLLPIEFRLAGTAVGATVLLALGWRISARRQLYGLVLQGGGVGILYLIVFAATRLYHLLPMGVAFPLMFAICALSAFLAIRQNAAPLAFMGSAGGFLAPVLLSSGGGSHIALFSYYALLDAGIFAIAWFKAWRPLNLLGFIFTFSIGSAWGITAYRPELFPTTEPFLILFFLMYVGIALLYAVRREFSLKHYIDSALVFGTPLVATGLQAALLGHNRFGLAWSAVALAAFYLAIAAGLKRHRARLGLLFDSNLALAVIFATLAIPLAFTGPATGSVWAIEGAALVWLSVRQRRLAPFGFGLLMQLAAAGAFLSGLALESDTQVLPVLNGPYLATLLIALAGLFTGWWLHARDAARAWKSWMPEVGILTGVWGLLWWTGSGLNEILTYANHHEPEHPERFAIHLIALFAVSTAWLAHAARRRFAWPVAEWPALTLAPALALLVLCTIPLNEAPSSGTLGALYWLLAMAASYALLWRQNPEKGLTEVQARVIAPLHTLTFWNLCGLLTLEGYWRLRDYAPEGAWSWSAWAYGYGLMLLLVSGAGSRLRWPVARFAHAYQVWGAAPLAVLLWLWSLAALSNDGSSAPLPFWLPVLNPLDVAQLLAFVAVLTGFRRIRTLGITWHPVELNYAAGATIFLWFNALLLRTLHHWTGVPYTITDLAHSMLVQASVSIFWTICALATMIFSTRRGLRSLWFIGATLLGVTVIKLFLFDLSHLQGIERIVSFIGIGVLLLLVGYFSPLPPSVAASTPETRK